MMRDAAGVAGHTGGAHVQSTSADYFKFVLEEIALDSLED